MNTALLMIDFQNDYFPNGRMPLDNSVEACHKAREALLAFRSHALPVVHAQHISTRPDASFFLPCTRGIEIHSDVAPLSREAVIKKHYPNCFRDTSLFTLLSKAKIQNLVICGMMTHMCVDATVRAAYDLGFSCTVLHDACTAKALEFHGTQLSAQQVHFAFLAALQPTYAKIASVREFFQTAQTTFKESVVA